MLGHLPATRSGELLYSILARLNRYLAVREAGPFMRAVAGRRHAIAAPDLPGGLAALAGDGEDDGAVDRLIDTATLFPFHTAFVSPDTRALVRTAMRGDVSGVYTKLGMAAFRVRPPDRLRFCPVCLDEMMQHGGDPWWRREHQLPGVPVCAVHGVPLLLSDVAPGGANRHVFVAASPEVCHANCEPAVVTTPSDLKRLRRLAMAAVSLLDDPPPPAPADVINARYRSRLAQLGLMRSACRVDHVALGEAFDARWGEVPRLIPGLTLGDDVEAFWLAALVRTGRRIAHPLQHLMLRDLLGSMPEVDCDRPFGAGPWPCRNPAADHHLQKVIDTVGIRHDRGVVYGDFACACGYLYTCTRLVDGTVGEPRYRRFGPLLAPALRRAIAQGQGLRATARSLGLDPKTLMREAAMAGVRVPWSTAASGSLPKNGRAESVAAPKRGRSSTRPRRNWFAIDTRMARSVRRAAADILAELPPRRVTLAEVEARVARRDWITKRRRKLPQTVVAIASVAEDTEAFRARRLRWQVAQALQSGEVGPCAVLRAAGLPTGWLDAVRNEIALQRCAGRAAA